MPTLAFKMLYSDAVHVQTIVTAYKQQYEPKYILN